MTCRKIIGSGFPRETPNAKFLLEKNGLSAYGWEDVAHNGYSGGRILKKREPDGRRFVLKVTTVENDLVMQLTQDNLGREVSFANVNIQLGRSVGTPILGAAKDGVTCVILMEDITDHMLPNSMLTLDQLTAIISAMQSMHAIPIERGLHSLPWCPISERLRIFRPDAERLKKFRITQQILDGWDAFFNIAPLELSDLVKQLHENTAPLEQALNELPVSILHGDMKIDNIGIDHKGVMLLIDWSLPLLAPAAIELGWFLAMNSRNIPVDLNVALNAYSIKSNIPKILIHRHECLTALCGLLIRGWRKGMDVKEGRNEEFGWWCQKSLDSLRYLSL